MRRVLLIVYLVVCLLPGLAGASSFDAGGSGGGGGGSGTVTASGPPVAGQASEWTSATDITGVAVSGTGAYCKTTSCVMVTPALGTPSSGVATNLTGTAAGLTAGLATTVTTNANLTGPITSIGNATAIASQTGTGTQFVMAAAPTITGGLHTALTTLGLRDTSGAFDVTIAATDPSTISAGRILTLGMGNVAHTVNFGTTANTITFPNAPSGTVGLLNLAQTWTAVNTYTTMETGTLRGPGNLTLALYPNTTGSAIYGVTITNGLSLVGTSGTQGGLSIPQAFAPTSGTALFTALNISDTINQTGGASGITRGLYINPTLTAAADFRAVEVALGPVLIVPLASATGARYVCVDTTGKLVSQAAACVGT